MGKKEKGGGGGGSVKKPAKSESDAPPPRAPITLREEATGKLKKKESTSIKSTLKVEHLKNLAFWAAREAHLPSFGAFYGHQLAAVSEAAGVPPDTSLITCQRFESVLHPGFNSTVRIEKNRSKFRHRCNKIVNKTQNNVVYKCHFCHHQNVKRGTPKGHTKGISTTSKNKSSSLESTIATKSIAQEKSSKPENKGNIIKSEDKSNVEDVAKDVSLVDDPATPSSSVSTTTLLDGGKKRMRNSSTSSMKVAESASMSAKSEASKTQGTGRKRRKRSWTSLKEQAQRNEHDNIASLTIPFLLK